jgi:hypothetical protein
LPNRISWRRTGRQYTPQNVKYNTIPIHPGAVRFYKEAGVQIPEALLPK